MSEFTASNGIPVIPDRHGGYQFVPESAQLGTITGVSANQAQALREFFQKENDDRLGRWRDPEQPEHVVYELFAATISVWSERYGTGRIYRREDPSETGSYLDRSAIAYFSTHAESKPAWHDAKHGEAWVLTVDGIERAARVDSGGRFVFLSGGMPFPDAITAGRRIYPEVAS